METKIFLILFIGNFIISVIWLIVKIRRKEITKGILMFLLFLLCPVIGPGFIILSWCFDKLFFDKSIDMGELSFRTDRQDMIVWPDYEKELNVVPVEEALLVSDNDDKRRVILDVLKEDYSKSLTVITNALESDDSETSHYVATVIADVKSNFKVTVQKMQENIDKFSDDSQMSCILIDYIHTFLDKKVLSEIEERTYIDQYIQLMSNLYLNHKDDITGTMYMNTIYHLLDINKRDEALYWGEIAITERPNVLDSYKGILKLYYETGEKKSFLDILTQLKQSNIEFDNEMLELVRFYNI